MSVENAQGGGGGGGGGGGAGTCRIHDRGGLTELHIAKPKIYMSLKRYTQQNTWHHNFLTYSIKQTLKAKKKYVTDLFTQKDTKDVNFQPKKMSDLPAMYTESTPPPPLGEKVFKSSSVCASYFYPKQAKEQSPKGWVTKWELD